ncbi:hypothetical protein [Hoylesella shahii]|uniref:hypothetical protein n=1 Tax=Hoylesella shahii TaxID=228603 RepID=UPI001E5A9F06
MEEKKRVRGCCITFEESQGKWRTKQFIGTNIDSWAQEASWEDFGGAGTIKSLTVNGRKQTADAEGNVSLTIDNIDVDESLDADSSNPVQNKAVATKLSEVEAGTVFGMTAELSDDANTVRLALTNKSGTEIASADIPAGGGGGGGDSSATKIVLTAGVDKTTIKEGDVVKLTYTYDHRNTDGESTGQKAAIQIMVKRGATTTYNETVKETGKGTYTLDLTKYLLLGTNDIYVIATTTDPTTGKAQRKQCYVPVKSVTLSLSTGYNLASGLSSGGYSSSEMVSVPFSVSGSGTKTVFLYVDGTQRNTETITRSGTTNGSFNLSMSGLSVGRHTVQMVAEMEADTLTLKSESIYFDFLKAGGNSPFIGLMITHQTAEYRRQGNI